MKKSIMVICLALNFYILNCQSTGDKNRVLVLIFKDQEKVNVYDSFLGQAIVYQMINDTIKESFFVIEVLGSENNRYQINAASILYNGIKGWIDLNNIGINTRPRNHQIILYSEPNYDSKHSVVFEQVANRFLPFRQL